MADASQQVIWTCLPNGLTDEGDLKVSVLISPRLTLTGGEPRLKTFRDWLDWPTTVLRDKWIFEVDGVEREAQLVSQPDSAVWKALFPDTTYVQTRAFEDFSGKTILSVPIADIERQISGVYQSLAISAEDQLPTAQSFGPLARPFQKPQPQRTVLARVRKDGVAAASREFPDALDLLAAYHQPLERAETHHYENQGPDDPQPSSSWRSQALVDLPHPEDFQKLIDFHQVVSALGQHPLLLRPTGLVLDFVVDGRETPAQGTIRFQAKWQGQEDIETLPDETPLTVYEIKDRAFTAQAADPGQSQIFGSWLRLTPKFFDVVQMDVDGAGLKVRNFTQSVMRTFDEVNAGEDNEKDQLQPHRTGAPALRSGGLTLAQRDRDKAVKSLFKASTKLQTQHVGGQTLRLFAEDLVRGYRVDVHDKHTDAWQSLCRRDGVYTLVNDGQVLRTEDEEGVVRLSATESVDGENADVMKVHGGLFVWRGWSLTAPLPMPVVGIKDEVAEPDNEAPEGLPLETDFSVHKGSLPSLRFGRTYRMRLRLVDLAGNSLALDDKAPDEVLSEQETYLRHEPVEAPGLALVQAPAEYPKDGESMGRIAIRTFNDPYDSPIAAAPAKVRRHVLAPRVTHNFAELNSALDTPEGRVDPALFSLLAQRDVAPGSITLATPAWRPDGSLEEERIKTPYSVAPEDYALTYLPDPLARGMAIRVFGLEHVDPEKIYRIDLYPQDVAWPDAAPFRVALIEGDGEPDFDAEQRAFIVPLARAERCKLRISCVLGERDLDLMAIWKLVEKKGLDTTALEKLQKRALTGQHWMLTPWRELDLVHAVQKPLVMPILQGFSGGGEPNGHRELGRTMARVGFETPLHAKSTVRVDLLGRWQEPEDKGVAPSSRESAGLAESWTLARQATPDGRWGQRQAKHDFPDTRARRVLYKLEATSRYREYMPPDIRTPAGGEPVKVTSEEVRVWIPNAAPPAPPQVRYVIPTFGWSRSESGAKHSSWRRGGGLRIYMDRPWFGSGHGELLAVVIPQVSTPNATIDGPLKSYVTQWGADPIWLGGRVERAAPRLGEFTRKVTGGAVAYPGLSEVFQDEGADLPTNWPISGLPLPGLDPNLRVDAVPHQVGYDPARKLYYCDVVINPGDAYFPFVRLALARYHPVSASGAHLSQVVLAEFQQLTPDRYLSVSRDGAKLALALHGHHGGTLTLGQLKSGQVKAELQELPAGGDPVLDWLKVTPPPELQPQNPWGEVVLRTISDPARAQPRSAVERALSLEAFQLSEAGKYGELLARPDLMQWVLPPQIWEAEVRLPPDHLQRRLRVLVTESERHPTGERDGAGAVPFGDRIVYAEAVEL